MISRELFFLVQAVKHRCEPFHAGFDFFFCGIGKVQAYRIPATAICIKGGAGKDSDTLGKGFFNSTEEKIKTGMERFASVLSSLE